MRVTAGWEDWRFLARSGREQASILSTEEPLSACKNNIEVQHAVAGSIFRWDRLCDQQIRTQRCVEQPVAGIERLAGKIHLGDQSLEPAMNLEMNMRRP